MKKIIVLIAAMAFSITAFCQGGVNFEHLTLDEALAKAKAEKKLVFMDCYTSWCGPCKYMAETIFPQEKAGEFFNPKFISVKFNMEKGEGPELAKKFGVKAYPTFFIIRPDGTVQHTIVGGGDLEGFIARVEGGLNEKTSLDYLNKAYEKGKMNKKQLLAYRNALKEAGKNAEYYKINKELADQLTDKDRLTPAFWPVIENEGHESDHFKFIATHLDAAKKKLGKEQVENYVYNNYRKKINGITSSKELEQIRQELSTANLEKKERLLELIDLTEARINGNVGKIISIAEKLGPSIDENERGMILSAIGYIHNKATKEELDEIMNIGEKYIQNASSISSKIQLENYFMTLKKLTHAGVYFENLSLDEAIAKAKLEHKPIFVDCYTSWCVPCKEMEEQVFSQKKAKDYFDKKFVCVKYDMEKGEGLKIRKQYSVNRYPTFLLLNPDGSMCQKIIGGLGIDDFIKIVEKHLDESTNLALLKKRLDQGDRDKAFLVRYIQLLMNIEDPMAQLVGNELFNTLSEEERVLPTYWFIFRSQTLSPINSDPRNYLTRNWKKFSPSIGEEKVLKCLSDKYEYEFYDILAGRDQTTTLEAIDQMGRDISTLKLLPRLKEIQSYVTITKAMRKGNIDHLITTCEQEYPKFKKPEFPFFLFKSIEKKATPEQKARWEKLKEKNNS